MESNKRLSSGRLLKPRRAFSPELITKSGGRKVILTEASDALPRRRPSKVFLVDQMKREVLLNQIGSIPRKDFTLPKVFCEHVKNHVDDLPTTSTNINRNYAAEINYSYSEASDADDDVIDHDALNNILENEMNFEMTFRKDVAEEQQQHFDFASQKDEEHFLAAKTIFTLPVITASVSMSVKCERKKNIVAEEVPKAVDTTPQMTTRCRPRINYADLAGQGIRVVEKDESYEERPLKRSVKRRRILSGGSDGPKHDSFDKNSGAKHDLFINSDDIKSEKMARTTQNTFALNDSEMIVESPATEASTSTVDDQVSNRICEPINHFVSSPPKENIVLPKKTPTTTAVTTHITCSIRPPTSTPIATATPTLSVRTPTTTSIDLLDNIFTKQDRLLADKYKSEQEKAWEKQMLELEKRRINASRGLGVGGLEKITAEKHKKGLPLTPKVTHTTPVPVAVESSPNVLPPPPPPPPPRQQPLTRQQPPLTPTALIPSSLPPPPPPPPRQSQVTPPTTTEAVTVALEVAEDSASVAEAEEELATEAIVENDKEQNDSARLEKPLLSNPMDLIQRANVVFKRLHPKSHIAVESSPNVLPPPPPPPPQRQQPPLTPTALIPSSLPPPPPPPPRQSQVTPPTTTEAVTVAIEVAEDSASVAEVEEELTTEAVVESDKEENEAARLEKLLLSNPKDLIQRANVVLKGFNVPEKIENEVQYDQIECDNDYVMEEEEKPLPDFHGEPVPDDDEDDDALFEIAAGLRPAKKRNEPPVIEDEPLPADEFIELDFYNADMNVKASTTNKWLIDPDNQDGFALMWGGVRSNYGVLINEENVANAPRLAFQIKVVEFLSLKHVPFEELEPHDVRIGWSTAITSNMLGESAQSYMFCSNARKATCNVFMDYGDPFHINDVITTVLDLERREIRFYKNGSNLGVAFSAHDIDLPTGAVVFPHVATKNCKVLVNFGLDQLPETENPDDWKLADDETAQRTTMIGLLERRCGLLAPSRRPPPDKTHCTVIVMVGLPGAGKTTWVKQYLRDHPDEHWMLFSTDTILSAMTVNGVPRRRVHQSRWDIVMGLTAKALNRSLQMACRRRHNYIIDQTNVSKEGRRKRLTQFADFQRKCVVMIPSDDELERRLLRQARQDSAGQCPAEAMLELKGSFSIPCTETEPIEDVLFVEPPVSRINEAIDRVSRYNAEGRPWVRKTYGTRKPESVISDNRELPNQWIHKNLQR